MPESNDGGDRRKMDKCNNKMIIKIKIKTIFGKAKGDNETMRKKIIINKMMEKHVAF